MSRKRQIQKLANFTDRTSAEIARANHNAKTILTSFEFRGYSMLETPLLEETDLFLRKSGGELASQLYEFDEPTGLPVSIRPEFTGPILRYLIENKLIERGIQRLCYFGSVLRGPDSGQTNREFRQLGAELIGGSDYRADAEIISMALEGLRSVGIDDVRAVVGNVGLIWNLLGQYPLSERARLFLVNSIKQIRERQVNRIELEELAKELRLTASTELIDSKKNIADQDIQNILLMSMDAPGSNAGGRTSEQIAYRLAQKQTGTDDSDQFKKALGFLFEFVLIGGTPAQALYEGKRLAVENGLDVSGFEPLEQLVTAVQEEGLSVNDIKIEFGLARNIAYYTGMVFDIVSNQELVLGGGGRYDGLTQALGGKEGISSLGFAYNFDVVMKQMDSGEQTNKVPTEVTFVKPANDKAWRAASSKVKKMRQNGKIAVLIIPSNRGLRKTEQYITVFENGTIEPGSEK